MGPNWLRVLVIGVLAAIVVACGSGGDNAASTATPTPADNYAPTGKVEVDHLINAALQVDTIEMAALTGYQKVPCTRSGASYPGAPPACRENEQEGAEVEVLPSTSCDFAWVRPEQVPDLYQSVLGTAPQLNSVYSLNPGLFSFAAGEVIVLQTGTRSDGSPSGVAFYVKDGRIVRAQTGCRSFQELTDPGLVQSFIVAPPP